MELKHVKDLFGNIKKAMIKNVKYVKLQEVLSRVLRNPLLKDTNME